MYLTIFSTEIKSLKCFIRSATWVTAGFAQKYAGEHGENFNCKDARHHGLWDWLHVADLRSDSDEQKKTFTEQPQKYLKYRKAVEKEVNQNFAMVRLM